MYVYVDLFLGLNILINALLIVLTAKLYGTRVRWLRVLLAAGAGGIYALGYICLSWEFLYSIPMKLLMSMLMIHLAFSTKTLSSLLRLTAAYYIACFVTGGAMAGWFYYRQSFMSALLEPISAFIGWHDLLGGAVLAICLLLAAKAGLLANLLRRSVEYQVEVVYRNKETALTAIVDTGNSLYSAGRRPVIIADYQAVQEVFSQQTKDFFSRYSPDTWLESLHDCEDKDWLARIQIIPFRALGGESVLIAFRPDMVKVRSKDSFIETSDVVIGVYAGSLSAKNRFTALLHPAILQFTVHKEVNTCVSPG
ncbi:MAG: sporulation factor SpoIIGA [Anaerosporomusa subterranea]|jgi:stage II sporulation protein GA (sporulation sigma-E factor processing peptidase)|nr:sporulation factor SpoIIGA [Anaerosporomusa subterranea]